MAHPQTSLESSDYPSLRYAWGCVLILICTAILSYTDRQILSLLVDPLRADLSITDTQVSLLLGTAFAVIYGVAGIPFGWLADRYSRRNLIFGGVVVWSLGSLACGFSQTFEELFFARVVVGLGESVLSPSAISLISDSFPPRQRGLAVGAFLSGIAIGSGASILIGGAALHFVAAGALSQTPFANLATWRLVLLLVGAPGLVWSLAILFIREPRRRVTELAGSAAEGWRAVRKAAPAYAVVALASLVDNAVGAWAPTLIIRRFSRSATEVGLALGLLLTVGFGVGVLLGGWISDRAGEHSSGRGKMVACLGLSVLILPVSIALAMPSYELVMTAVPLYFLLSGAVTASGFSKILDEVPANQRAFAMAVSFFLNVAIGAGLGPTAVALLAERVPGASSALAVAIAAVVFVVYTVNAIIATLSARRNTRSP